MNLHRMLAERAASGKPLRVLLIGAGKFGSMFLARRESQKEVERIENALAGRHEEEIIEEEVVA